MKFISELNKMIIGPSDLRKTFNYFFDCVENSKINELSKILSTRKVKDSTELTFMLKNIQTTLSEFFKQEINIEKFTLFLIPHKKFIHGFCTVKDNAMPIPILYFSDVKVGAFALTENNSNTNYFRFALAEVGRSMQSH